LAEKERDGATEHWKAEWSRERDESLRLQALLDEERRRHEDVCKLWEASADEATKALNELRAWYAQ